MTQHEEDKQFVEDIIEEIVPVDDDEDEDDDEFEFDDEDGDFIRIDDLGNSVERVVDVLGGIFVSSEGSTVADILNKISESLDRHVAAVEAQTAILEKQSKVLFKLAKVLENSK
jgi:hypothetical protein